MKKLGMMRRVMRALMACCLVGSVAGCAMPAFLDFSGEKVKWSQITLNASSDANSNSPIAVDVVLVSDEAMLARLAELPAAKWFSGRADLVRTFPHSLRYRSWELVPGQRVEVPGDAFSGPRVIAAFIFANYPEPGASRVRIEQFDGQLVVKLDTHTFSLSARN